MRIRRLEGLPGMPLSNVPIQADLLPICFVARGMRAYKRCRTFVLASFCTFLASLSCILLFVVCTKPPCKGLLVSTTHLFRRAAGFLFWLVQFILKGCHVGFKKGWLRESSPFAAAA
jgi:hypothetical protein